MVINHIVLGKLFSTFLCFRISKWFKLIFWLICLFCIYMFILIQACYQLSKLGNRYVFLLDNIKKKNRQATFLTNLKFNEEFSLSFFKIDWTTEPPSFNKFFFGRQSGFAAFTIDRDEFGSLMNMIRSRVSLFISIAKSDLGPMASSTLDLCTIILSNLESFAIHLKRMGSLACRFRISEIRQRKTN